MLSRLVERAIRAELNFTELNRELDALGDIDDFEASIAADLRTGVEHTPGFWRRPGVNNAEWQTMEEYWMLVADAKLLRLQLPDSVLCRIHEELLEQVPLSEHAIDNILRGVA